jgi:hypothetical protein
MREDDDAPQQGTSEVSPADGLGETAGSGDYSSTSEPYGDDDIDDTYGDDTASDETTADDTTADDTTADDTTADDTTADDSDSDDGGYGNGESGDEVVIYEEPDDTEDTDASGADADADATETSDGTSLDDGDVLAQDASPLEGIGFLIDEVRDALFGDDDEAAANAFDVDPADLASATDLDLTGDGVVDRADLQEAESPLDFDVDHSHDPGHDGGVIDA